MSDVTDEELMALARAAAENAYAPYSNFRVGGALVGEDGTVHTGANIENAAYPSGLCAEAVTIGHAAASGVRRIRSIAIACLDVAECYPCGNCRQRMREFGTERVLVQDGAGGIRVHAFDELLPRAFGPDSLRD